MVPYLALSDRTVRYVGNRIFEPIDDVLKRRIDQDAILNRVLDVRANEMWRFLMLVHDQIYTSAVEYFRQMGARFVPLPLTTRMISSPGAVYGRDRINYTTDTCPITLDWFGRNTAFLAESSQIYLELSLLTQGTDHVYCIYNSFRKEEADATHLPEFRHIEYEGHVNQNQNKRTALNLIFRIVDDLLNHPASPLEYFLQPAQLNEVSQIRNRVHDIEFVDALDALYRETGDEIYRKFTLQHFSSWEEMRLTDIYDGTVLISHFPLLEVPFYHGISTVQGPNGERLAENTDIIWRGYREVLGSGQRVGGRDELEEKAVIFGLPGSDYQPYLQSRCLEGYRLSSGFGLGWERLVQGLLCLPFIYTGVMFPRTHLSMCP